MHLHLKPSKSRRNNTFISYDASARIPPMFLATNRPERSSWYTARLHTNAKKPAVSQQQSKEKVQTGMCRYINGNLNVRFSSCLNAQFDICFKRMWDVLRNWKTAAFIIEIDLGSCYTRNIEILIKVMTVNQCQMNCTLVNRLWMTTLFLFHLHITFVGGTVTHQCSLCVKTLWMRYNISLKAMCPTSCVPHLSLRGAGIDNTEKWDWQAGERER